jgi:hypothetical protein
MPARKTDYMDNWLLLFAEENDRIHHISLQGDWHLQGNRTQSSLFGWDQHSDARHFVRSSEIPELTAQIKGFSQNCYITGRPESYIISTGKFRFSRLFSSSDYNIYANAIIWVVTNVSGGFFDQRPHEPATFLHLISPRDRNFFREFSTHLVRLGEAFCRRNSK